MSFFAGCDFFMVLFILLIPAVLLGLSEKKLKWYRWLLSLFFIWEVYGSTKIQLLYLIGYVIFAAYLVKIYLYLRKKYGRNKYIYGHAVFLSLLPLLVYKIGGLRGYSVFGFLGISYICFKIIQVVIECYDGVINEIDEFQFIKTPGANVELLSTWRTQDQALISLWNEVRTRADMITEKLVINGPYSEDIGPNVFKRECEDEVILCLNYDGKFGLNNMNNYFQAANTKGEAIPWAEWSYKVGDPILFNDSKRFDLLYNNLKGRIVDIEKHSGSISFTVDVEIPLTELICKRDGIEFIESIENGTRIRFAVYEYDESKKGEDLDENLRLKSVVPFQLAYAVSIHKAQGLEYDSVKVIIPSNNAEKITHGIFYTAITRAKTNLKIYWSSESMHDVVKGFATDESKRKSLEIVKTKLGKN